MLRSKRKVPCQNKGSDTQSRHSFVRTVHSNEKLRYSIAACVDISTSTCEIPVAILAPSIFRGRAPHSACNPRRSVSPYTRIMVKVYKVFCPANQTCKYQTCQYRKCRTLDAALEAQKHHLVASSSHFMAAKDADELMQSHPDFIVEEEEASEDEACNRGGGGAGTVLAIRGVAAGACNRGGVAVPKPSPPRLGAVARSPSPGGGPGPRGSVLRDWEQSQSESKATDRAFRIQETVLVKIVQSLTRAEKAARSAASSASREADALNDSRRQVEDILANIGTAE